MRSQRLTRSLTDRTLGGVCGGLGTFLDLNAWWIRGLFVVFVLLTAGTGILVYLALWLILPSQTLADIRLSTGDAPDIPPNAETVITVGAVVIVIGIIVLARSLGVLDVGDGDIFLPVVVIGFGLTLLIKHLWRSA
ncbi:MAG: PspC domain-containing protein [Anaerolineae bacterium]|nr:PspC domain-containing protein [Anaerolineae bacterium]